MERTGLALDVTRTALLAMDCQTGLVGVYTKPQDAFVERVSKAVAAARKSGMPVIMVQVGFRPGLPEVSSRNKLFAAVKSSPRHQQFFAGASGAIHPSLGPEAGDIVIVKHRVSAFAGTDLEMILSSKAIDTLVLFGIATSGVVLSTLVEAFDADFRIVVIADCCADLDDDLHRTLLQRLFPARGEVVTADEFVTAVAAAPSGLSE